MTMKTLFSAALVMILATMAGCAVENEETSIESNDGTAVATQVRSDERAPVTAGAVEVEEEGRTALPTTREGAGRAGDEPMLVHVLPFFCASCAQPGVPQPR